MSEFTLHVFEQIGYKARELMERCAMARAGTQPGFDKVVEARHDNCRRVVGAVGLRLANGGDGEREIDIYYVESLCVDPAFRRRGVATQLLAEVDKLGLFTVLYVCKGGAHDWLRDFYCKNGYSVVESPVRFPLRAGRETLLACGCLENYPFSV